MYPTLRSPSAAEGAELTLVGGPLQWLRVSRNVVFLGLTSMLTDISSEMVNAVLPLYLVFQLGLGPLAYGAFAGGYVGITAAGRLFSGVVGDRGGDHKRVAVAGYGISAICKLGVLAAGGAAWLTSGVLYLDRIGKGVRTTPRDAMISLSSPRERLGEAFGVHRALDTTGAVFGPVAAFLILTLAPGGFSIVFAVSFAFAVAGVVTLVTTVRNPHRADNDAVARPTLTLVAAAAVIRRPGIGGLGLIATILGVATISDSFVYLALQNRTHMSVGYFPLLYVGTSAFYLALAIPAGRIADRIGRLRVFLTGYAALFGVYLLLLLPTPGWTAVLLALALFGTFYAATDGVLMALAGALLPGEARGTGMAVITSSATIAQFASSLMFGAIWAWQGPVIAVRVFGFALLIVLAASAAFLPSRLAPAEAAA